MLLNLILRISLIYTEKFNSNIVEYIELYSANTLICSILLLLKFFL